MAAPLVEHVPVGDELPIGIREFKPADEPFVYATWMDSYRHAIFDPRDGRAALRRFNVALRAHIDSAIRAGRVYIACNPDDADQIYGWACIAQTEAGPIVHYVYVKMLYRGLGVCRRLVASGRWVPGSKALVAQCTRDFAKCYAGRYADLGLAP